MTAAPPPKSPRDGEGRRSLDQSGFRKQHTVRDDMDRSEKKHTPLPTTGSVVDPAAEAAHRHLSWTPDDDRVETDGPVETVEFDKQDFVSYTGFPDGTFEVAVTLDRGRTVSIQQERGVGETSSAIQEALLKAYEKADRALLVIRDDTDTVEEIDPLDEDEGRFPL